MKLTIVRIEERDCCTRGVLFVNDEAMCVTLELPWKDNQRNISCIPKGEYEVFNHYSPTFKDCLAIKEVNGRTNILIHSGNTTDDTQGCIIVGSSYGKINDKPAVLNSKKALRELLALCANIYPTISLTIK